MEHHLSIFRPYDRDAKHEDQLTRAALIVLKLIPLAHDAFLELIARGPTAGLPPAIFDMQTGTLLPLRSEDDDLQIKQLISVLLGPHDDAADTIQPDLSSERGARYDGVIQYGSELLVVIESKLYANASDRQALKINTAGLGERIGSAQYRRVRWQELLDRWLDLLEIGILGMGETEVLNDFFDNAETNFGDLLPYTNLERCGQNAGRRQRRLRAVLEEATGLSAEIRESRVRVKFPDKQVTTFDRISLFIENGRLTLSAWPGELAPQYKPLYSSPEKIQGLISLIDNPAWRIIPSFYLSYWQASGPQRWYPKPNLDGAAYVRQWERDFQEGRAGRKPREQLNHPDFRSWLIEGHHAVQDEMGGLDEWAAKLPMKQFDVRPSVQVSHSWQWTDAVEMDKAGELVLEVRQAIDELLAALGEPAVAAIAQ